MSLSDNLPRSSTSHTISIVARALIHHFRHLICLPHPPASRVSSFTLYNVANEKQPRSLMAHRARSFKR